MASLLQRVRSDGILATLVLMLRFIKEADTTKAALQFGKLRIFTSCDFSSSIPSSTIIPHPIGIVIGRNVELGDNVLINQNVTLAKNVTVEDNVKVRTGATVTNNTTLHEGCVVGANSVVLDDVPAGETVVGAPARVIE